MASAKRGGEILSEFSDFSIARSRRSEEVRLADREIATQSCSTGRYENRKLSRVRGGGKKGGNFTVRRWLETPVVFVRNVICQPGSRETCPVLRLLIFASVGRATFFPIRLCVLNALLIGHGIFIRYSWGKVKLKNTQMRI